MIDRVDIAPMTELCLLGVHLDKTLSFIGHLNNVIRSCYYHLQRIKMIRCYLSLLDMIKLVRALILTRVDYCNSLLLRLPDSLLNCLQSVLNVSARLIYGNMWNEHVTPLL